MATFSEFFMSTISTVSVLLEFTLRDMVSTIMSPSSGSSRSQANLRSSELSELRTSTGVHLLEYGEARRDVSTAAPAPHTDIVNDGRRLLNDSSPSNEPIRLKLRDTLSGAVGSVALTYTGLPFDTVKVRLSTAKGGAYSGMFDCAAKLIRNEGVLRLWSGATPALSSAVLENSVLFTTNGFLKRLISSNNEANLKPLDHALIGLLSGCVSATAICPSELVKCRMQISNNSKHASGPNNMICFKSVRHCVQYTFAHEGIRGFFTGLTPLLLRDLPFNFIFFGGYRFYAGILEKLFPIEKTRQSPESFHALAAGALSGMSAWAVVFPADVLKSRMQVSAMSGHAIPSLRKVMYDVYREGGIPLFYKGVVPAVCRAGPANGALFFAVEFTNSMCDKFGLE